MPRRFSTSILLPGDPSGALEAAPKQYVDSKDAGAAHLTGNETIQGVKTIPSGSANSWIFNQPPQVAQGTVANHAARRDDPKFPVYASSAPSSPATGSIWVDSTSTTADVPPATVPVARLPRSLAVSNAITTTSTTPLTVDLTTYTGPVGLSVTCLHDSGIAVPTGTPDNFQVIRIEALASGAQRTFTFPSACRLSTGLAARTFTIPSGQVLKASVEYSALLGAWVLTAATVSVT